MKQEKINYLVFENYLDKDRALAISKEIDEIPEDVFIKYSEPGFEFNKFTYNQWPGFGEKTSELLKELLSEEQCRIFELMFDFKKLYADFGLWGGGIHKTKEGGYLAVHRDFNVLPGTYHKKKRWRRVLNLIIYLSDWKVSDGGALEFWKHDGSEKVVSIDPVFNRGVVFDTRGCYHGHPYPFKGLARKSIAVYFYEEATVPDEDLKSTDYLALPWMDDSPEYQESRRRRSDASLRYRKKLTSGI